MANQEHLDLLKQGVEAWNQWLEKHPDVKPDLSDANLGGSNLRGAKLNRAILNGANLRRAELSDADLNGANLNRITLDRANLSKANLTRAIVVEANLENAVLNSCSNYGIAAWDVQLEGAKQDSLIITRDTEPTITVDNLKVAQ